jgi:hypothetical protein
MEYNADAVRGSRQSAAGARQSAADACAARYVPAPPRTPRRAIARAALCAGALALCAMLLPAGAQAVVSGGISGQVTNAASVGIEGFEVCATPTGGGVETCTETASEGKYRLEGLKEDEYTVIFTGDVCAHGSCEPTYEDRDEEGVKVTAGSVTENVDMQVFALGKISGRVTAGGVPAKGVEVCAFGYGFGCEVTDANGEYTIEDLPEGQYGVGFEPGSECKIICEPSANVLEQFWDGQSSFEAADPIDVVAGKSVTGVNAELAAGGHISGKVTTNSIYPQPIANSEVCASSAATDKEGEREDEEVCTLTNASGEYTISALASHPFEVQFESAVCAEVGGTVKCTHPYIGATYPSLVAVSAPGTTSGINGSLAEASPTKPTNTAAPTLSGGTSVGSVLSCSTGSWGNNPSGLSYRWLLGGSAISGQTSDSYTVLSADAGLGIACEVTASNGAGTLASTSNTVQIPKPQLGLAVLAGARVKGATVYVKLRCTGENVCSGVARIEVRAASGHGRHKRTHTVTIAVGSYSMAVGRTITLRIGLTGQGRALLARAGRRGLKVQIAGSGVEATSAVLKR